MNTIKIYLKDSGSIAELYKDFRLYAGSYQDKSIKVYVPKSMVYQSTDLNTMLATVKVGAILTNEKGQKITTKSYAVVYIAEEVVNGIDYLVYERQLPKEFCAIAGNQTVVVNVENMLNEEEQSKILSNITSQTIFVNVENNPNENETQNIIATQTVVLEVLDSASLNENEVVEPSELDLINAQINDIYQAIGLGEVDYEDVINRVENLENNSVTLDTEQTITATKTIDLPMNVGNGYRGLVFKKGSGGGTVPVAIEFVDANNNSIALVSPASDGVYFSGNITFMHNLNNFSIDEVPTKIEMSVDPSNYVLTTNLKNDSNTVLSTATVDLPLESMVVNGTYDNETKEVVLTLQNGNEVRFSVADLVSGLVSQTDFDKVLNNTTKIANASGGFAGGRNATISGSNGNGGAIGLNATATSGGAIGFNSSTLDGGSVGYNAYSSNGGSVGYNTRTSNGFAGGYNAKAVDSSNNGIDAIQLGTGTNSSPKTLQIYNDNIYDANTHTLTVTGAITDGENSVTVANTPQLDKENTFTQTQTFTAKGGTKSQDGLKIFTVYEGTGFSGNQLTFSDNVTVGQFNIDKIDNELLLNSYLMDEESKINLLNIVEINNNQTLNFVAPKNICDLGNSNNKWQDLYLSRNLTDGTNSITVKEIASKEYVDSNISSNSFTEEDKENLDANTSARHTHSNKDVLDGTTASYTVEEKGKLNGIEAQANRVTSTSQILNDSGYITIDNVPTTLAELSSDATHRTVTDAEKESWNSKLSQFTETDPTVPTYVKNITEEDITNWNSKVNISDIPTKTSQLTNDSGYITNQVNNLVNYTLATNTGSTIEVSVDSNTFIGTISLKNNSGTVISSGTFDLPLETVVVNGYFDEDTKKIVLVLQNGNEISIDASSLINGLASQSDLTSLTNTVNNKVDKVTGKGLSSNDFTDTDKNNLDANTTSRHTHSNKSILDATTASYTTTEKSKLSGIETGAQVNVQADWNESNTASSAYIKNKPTIPADLSGTVVTLDGTQTITGKKTFENIFSVQHNGVTTLNSILVDDYSIALYSTSGTSTSDIHQNKIDISNTSIQVITDNNTKFTYNGNEVATLEELNSAKNSILDKIYPIGSCYISHYKESPASRFGGQWEEADPNRALWTTSSEYSLGMTTIEAGLPNITGQIAGACYEGSPIDGAFATINTGACTLGTRGGSVVKYNTFDASRSNSIYGKSSTVQPPAVRIYLWFRVG